MTGQHRPVPPGSLVPPDAARESLARVLAGRRKQLGFRAGTSMVIAVCYGGLLGWAGGLSWCGLYLTIQAVEVLCFSGRRPLVASLGPVGYPAALAILAANNAVFGALAFFGVLRLGAWGEAMSAYLVAGAILNVVATTVGCRAAFAVSLAPLGCSLALLPMVAASLAQPASTAIVTSIAIGSGLLLLSAITLWKKWSLTKAAEEAALRRDIEQRSANEARLLRLAHEDTLTGLANRAALHLRLGEMVADQTAMALLVVDLDGFKYVNDTLGHTAGDQVLREVSLRVAAAARNGDIAARLGGDEFALVLPKVSGAVLAEQVGQRVIAAMSTPVVVDGNVINVGASVGIALYPQHGRNVEELLSNADLALYRAKAEGRNCSRFYAPDLREKAIAKLSRDSELSRAIEHGEFEIMYQPQIRLRDGFVAGAEALLRWRHPMLGLLPPSEFMPALEGGRLATQAGDWVLETACAQAAAWRRQGLPNFRIAVNLFGAQFRSGDVVDKIASILARTGLPPHALEVEITENVILKHEDDVLVPLRELRARGIGVAFDDYGTGYASLSLLKNYPLTRLKIDQSFIKAVCDSASDAAIVRAVVSMARAFRLQVVAEGVETELHADTVAACGCDEAQGFLFGMPMNVEDFTRLAVVDRASGPSIVS